MTNVTAEIVLFEGFDELDAIGPYEVFENAARGGAPLETRLVALDSAEVVTAGHGLRVGVDGVLGEPDLLVVPGGGWTTDDVGVRQVVEDGRLGEAVVSEYEGGATVASVCTGAMVLAEAGLLEDTPAITHHGAIADLEATAEVVDARVVDSGDVLTAGGVTSGIDLALWIVEREFGEESADRVAREMEHDRRGEVYTTTDG